VNSTFDRLRQNKANSGRSFKFEGSSVKTGTTAVGASDFTLQTRPKAVCAKQSQCATGKLGKEDVHGYVLNGNLL
jgi:hypothetical protein